MMHVLKKYLLLLSCFSCLSRLYAVADYQPKPVEKILEPWRWHRISELNGYKIFCMAEDGDGNLWFGAEDAVIRYDGLQIVKHATAEGLSGEQVNAILVTLKGDIWAGLANDLYRLKSGRWERVHLPFSLDVNACRMIETSDGSVWVGTREGLVRILKDAFERFTNTGYERLDRADTAFVERSSGHFNVIAIYEDSARRLWIGCANDSVYTLDLDGAFPYKLQPVTQTGRNVKTVQTYFHFDFYETDAGMLWLPYSQSNYGIDRFNPKTGRWSHLNPDAPGDAFSVHSVGRTGDGAVWMAGYGRIDKLHHNTLTRYTSEELGLPLGSYVMYPRMADEFILTISGIGVYILDMSDVRWRTFPNLHFQCETADGTQWFLEKGGGVVSRATPSKRWTMYTRRDGVISDPLTLIISESGNIWGAGAHEGTAASMVFAEGRWIRHVHPELAEMVDYRSVFASSDSMIYLGCGSNEFDHGAGGLKQFNERNAKWRYLGPPAVPKRIVGIVRTGSDSMWFGGRLAWHSGAGFEYVSLNGWRTGWIDDLLFTHDHSLWIAQGGKGVCRLKQGVQTVYTANDGLASDMVSSLLETEDGHVWAGTDAGISRFDGIAWMPHALAEHFNIKRESGTLRKSRDGAIWVNQGTRPWFFREMVGWDLGRVKGEFRTVRYQGDERAPTTLITQYIAEVSQPGNTTIFWQGYDAWRMTPEHHLQYSWRLNDQPWSAFSSETHINLLDLKHGSYVFEVRSRDADLNMDPMPARIEFRVMPPFWKQPGVLAVFWSLVCMVLYLAIRIIRKNQILADRNIELEETNMALILSQEAAEKSHKAHIISELNYVRLEAERIHELDELKLKFFTNISHELRTPLSLIIGPLESLLKNSRGMIRFQYETMLRNARRLQHLVDQVLDFRKLESGRMRPEPVQGDLIPFVMDCLHAFDALAVDHDIRLVFRKPSDSIPAWFDPDKLEKILYNLLSNAFKYTQAHGEIRVSIRVYKKNLSVRSDEDWVEIDVSDTGPGIEENEIPCLFERYYQARQSPAAAGKGTGIGLAHTKELVELLGGTIHAKSKVNAGACFTVGFPICPPESASAPVSSLLVHDQIFRNEEPTDSNRAPLILIIEDNADMCAFIGSILRESFRVIVEKNGRAGIDTALEAVPDLIISDIMMPGKNGFEVTHTLRTHEVTRHIPIILLTAKTSSDSRITGLQTGADAYITKPFKPSVLKSQVDNLLHSRKMLRERFSREVKIEGSAVALTSIDAQFLQRAIGIVEKHMANPDFDLTLFTEEIGMSKSALLRKLKSLTNLSILGFIKTIRLKRACQLLSQGGINVTEVCFEVGFSSLGNFIDSFKKQYHKTPSEVLKANKNVPGPAIDKPSDLPASRSTSIS